MTARDTARAPHWTTVVGLIAALGTPGCQQGALPQERVAQRAITNGTEDSGHPSVGLLTFDGSGGGASCTATLVGARTALTAAHCAGFANTVLHLDGTAFPASESIAHGDYDSAAPYLADLGLVLLPVAPPVTPTPLLITAPGAAAAVVLVGFGHTGPTSNDAGTKRVTTNSIDSIEPAYVVVGGEDQSHGSVCPGDSGGPVLVEIAGETAVAAVVSYTPNQQCGGESWDTRVDVQLAWLREKSADDLMLLDREAPTVTIVTPAADDIVGSPLTIAAEAADNIGVVEVEARLDGAPFHVLPAPPFAFETELDAGAHTITVVARDRAGNEGSASVTVQATAAEAGASGDATTDAGPLGGDTADGPERADPALVGGCALGGGAEPWPPAALALVMMALGPLLRRRRHY